MTNKEFAIQLAQAIDGDSAAMQTVLLEYDPLFRNRSRIDGVFDEDCYQHICLRAVEMTQRFKVD